jgi:hypothetical protein
MARKTIVILLSLLLGSACKDSTVKPDLETQKALDSCKKTLEEKDKLIQAMSDEAASLRRGGAGNEIVVVLEGNALTVKPPKPGENRPIDDKAVAVASKEFYDIVQSSKGAIQKCYEQALKKNTNLQAKSVTLTVSASFSNQGAYQNASFSASAPLGDTFDNCMKTVATKWSLPAGSQAMTFKAQVSLTPS